jgi:hypothetical protein
MNMSYDVSISLKPTDHTELKSYIRSLPNTALEPAANLRMMIGNTHYIEIDLEHVNDKEEYESGETAGVVNHISFHIPYDFMNKHRDGIDAYYEYIQHIADHVGSRAMDMQSGVYIDDPAFEQFRVRGLTGNMNAYFNAIEKVGNRLHFSCTTSGYFPLSIDLENFKIIQATKKTIPKPEYPPFQMIRHMLSPSGKWIALAHWKDKKQLKLFSAGGVDIATEGQPEALWKNDPEISINGAGQVTLMAFSEDDKMFFSNAYRNKTLKLWDRATGSLMKNFSVYAGHIGTFMPINDKLLCICSGAGITFFDIASGKTIVHIAPLENNWIAFTPNGDYEFKTRISGAIELDWIDNDKNESHCFIPGLGFAYYERQGNYKLNKVKEARGAEKEGLLALALAGYN